MKIPFSVSNPEILRRIIKQKIKEKSIPVSRLEKMAGLGAASLRNFLAGKTDNPKLKTLKAIASILDIELQELLDDSIKDVQIKACQKNWNQKLFMDITAILGKFLQEQEIEMTTVEAFSTIQNYYCYCLEKNISDVEVYFFQWMLSKTLKKDKKESK